MLFTVPHGAKAGDRLVLDTSTGARWIVPLPPGATHGTTLTIARPQTAAPNEHIVQVVLATELPPGAVGAVEASPRAAASSASAFAEGSPGGGGCRRQHATLRPPPGPETWDVGGWQVVITDGHAVLPEGMTHLPDKAFLNRTSLVSVAGHLSRLSRPRSLASIGSSAFEGCSSLVSIDLPAGLTSIAHNAFNRCSALTSITLPDGITSIGSWAFYRCSALTSVTFPAGLVSIGSWAFYGCSSLTRVTLPAGLTSIEDGAFYDCSALASVTFPAGLTSIGSFAFRHCSALVSVTFPAGLTSIGQQAFDGCSALARVTVPTTAKLSQGVFRRATTVLRLPPARVRWYEAVDRTLAYKRFALEHKADLLGWLERVNIRLGSYGPDGAARQRDRDEFEGDFGPDAAPGGEGSSGEAAPGEGGSGEAAVPHAALSWDDPNVAALEPPVRTLRDENEQLRRAAEGGDFRRMRQRVDEGARPSSSGSHGPDGAAHVTPFQPPRPASRPQGLLRQRSSSGGAVRHSPAVALLSSSEAAARHAALPSQQPAAEEEDDSEEEDEADVEAGLVSSFEPRGRARERR